MKKGELFVLKYNNKFISDINFGDILILLEDAFGECYSVNKIKCLNIKSGKIVETWSDFVEKNNNSKI